MLVITINAAIAKNTIADLVIVKSSSESPKDNITIYLTIFINTPEIPCPVDIANMYLPGRKLASPYKPDSTTAFANPWKRIMKLVAINPTKPLKL